jgi:hypothetical protein
LRDELARTGQASKDEGQHKLGVAEMEGRLGLWEQMRGTGNSSARDDPSSDKNASDLIPNTRNDSAKTPDGCDRGCRSV